VSSTTSSRKDQTIGSVVAHPLRARCLSILAERTASPVELAHELRKPLSDVSYHIAMLLKAGAVELVGERPARGSIEHFYRALKMPLLDQEETEALTLDERLEFVRIGIQLVAADAIAAIDAKTFNRRPNSWNARLPLVVDEEGWEELNEIYAEAWKRMEEVTLNSSRRRAERGADDSSEDIRTLAFITLFERPEH
jgi:DNA-binding transcriptional ArsR family regulator